MRSLVAGLFLVLATISLAQDAPRPLDELWREATLWEVGSNAERVPLARQALVARGEEALDFLIPSRLDTKDTLVTRALSVVVKGLAEPAKIRLRQALAHEAPDVRRNAADLLGQLGDEASAPAIAALLGDAATRGGALAALGALRSRASAGAVAGILDGSAHAALKERERVSAAQALGDIGGPDAEAALVRALSDDAAQVRHAAQLALERQGNASPLLAVAAGRGGPARLHAIAALGRIGDAATAPVLVPLLRDSVPEVRGFAAEALGRLAQGADEAALAAALEAETDAFARGKMTDALEALRARGERAADR